MTPKISSDIKIFKLKTYPSKTYKVNFDEKQIRGFTDELAAIKQAIAFILNTERYMYEIYSWNYGIELNDLFGEQLSYIYPELKRRIIQALINDDRIKDVDDFSFIHKTNEVIANFTVHTIFGDINAEKVVKM